MIDSWKKQFKLINFIPIHDDPRLFITSQWQRHKTEPKLLYVIYRTAIMLIFVVTWIMTIINEAGVGKWPIFLTNWGYTLCTFQVTLACLMVWTNYLGFVLEKRSLSDLFLAIYPVYWVLNIVATSTAFTITVVYWSVIFDPKIMEFDALNYFVHGNNSLLVFLDLWIVAHPIRLLHVIYPVIFGFTYTIFTFIYYSAGGTSKDGSKCIYKIVDWDKPGPTIATCLGVIVFLIILHFIMMAAAMVRQNLEKNCNSKKIDITMTETRRQNAFANEAISTEM